MEERAIEDQPEKGEFDLQTQALEAESLQDAQPHLLVNPSEIEQHAGDFCFELTNETANVDREVLEVEMCPTATESELWDLGGPEPAHAEDQNYNSQATVSLLVTSLCSQCS